MEVKNINGYDIKDSKARDEIEILKSQIEQSDSNIKFVCGVARYQNGEWSLLNDTGHKPLNIASIESINVAAFKINYSFTASKVLSLVATPDETYANKGYMCGGSVGLDNSVFNVSMPRITSANVHNNGSEVVVDSQVTDIPMSCSVVTHNSLGNYLRITHADMDGVPILLPGNKYEWKTLGYGAGYINVQAYLNGEKIGVPTDTFNFMYVKGPGHYAPKAHPDASNIWILGAFEVNE